MLKVVHRVALVGTIAVGIAAPITAVAQAQTLTQVSVTAQVSRNATASMPLVRLQFTTPLSATQLPPLRLTPALSTRWQQISANEVQAIAVGVPAPAVSYSIAVPSSFRCAQTCTVTATHFVQTASPVNIAWEDQLLAQLNYLPVSFTAFETPPVASSQVPGTFSWRFAALAPQLEPQWSVGTDNVVLRGALMNFQNVHELATTGEIDPTTWNTLVHAADFNQLDPATYNYVSVAESRPEDMTLYLNGVAKFQALVNTGIPQSQTQLGTYPVYLRYRTQTMRGTNPNGTHYADAGIPWISYFYGGDALHGFIRSSYGFPQSLGCVEMPFASAAVVWPHTPIGTLVTVHP